MAELTLGQAALAYAARGWRVIALNYLRQINGVDGCSCFKHAECKAIAKHPMFPKWREIATTDPAKIKLWWKHHPRANIGVLTGGQAGLMVLDVDGDEGRASLAQIEAAHEPLPVTLGQSTGRAAGGTHYLFRVDPMYADWIRTRARLAPGLDIRAEGGMIVAAPSLHRSGTRYAWINDAPIAEMPEWLFKLVTSQRERQLLTSAGARPPEAEIEATWPVRHRLAFARAALLAAPPAIQGEDGSGACFKAVNIVVRGFLVPVEDGAALDLLMRVYNPRCAPRWSEYEMLHKINSVVENGEAAWGYRLDFNKPEAGAPVVGGAPTPAPVAVTKKPAAPKRVKVEVGTSAAAGRDLAQLARDLASPYPIATAIGHAPPSTPRRARIEIDEDGDVIEYLDDDVEVIA